MLVFLLVLFLLYALTGWKIFKTLGKIVAFVWLVIFFFGIGTAIGIFASL